MKEVSFEQIRTFAQGAVEVCQEGGMLRFYRFNQAQRDWYAGVNEGFGNRSRTSACVCLAFRTDSTKMELAVRVEKCTLRRFFSFDIFVNGQRLGQLHDFDPETITGDHAKQFELGPGEKTVEIYFPWSVYSWLRALKLEEGAFAQPAPRKKTLLLYGDSITQGFDSHYPSSCYAIQLARWLDAQCCNRAVGGDVFNPAVAELESPICPDYITVAYGTNDWAKSTPQLLEENSRKLAKLLRQRYPEAKIFMLSPIWRDDMEPPRAFGPFETVETLIRQTCESTPGVVFLSGRNFVPEDVELYEDRRLHPNDEGFGYYAESLKKAMLPYLHTH